jgi:hypothetical protein
MYVGSVINLDSCYDCRKLEQALGVKYENDAKPYEIWILGDPNKHRIQVRLETGGALGELSMSIQKRHVTDTDELIQAVSQRIELMLDEAEACAR